MKKDIHGHEQRYKNWKADILNDDNTLNKKYIEQGLTKKNSDILIQYVLDMEVGANVSNKNKKGGRSYPRLNNIRQRISQMMRMLQNRGVNEITKLKEKQIMQFFSDMRTGVIKTKSQEKYKSASDYVKIFKSFWRWYIKVNRKKGIVIYDIVEDLDSSNGEQPSFVYLSKDNLKKILPYFTEDEQVLLMFVYDSIIRSPTELMSLQVKDIYFEKDEVWVNVPDNISKTFGRKFNLLYCGEELVKYIKRKELRPTDYLFNFSYSLITNKMKKAAKQVLGNIISDTRAGGLFSELTLYDLRHSGAIHLRILASKNGKISLDAIRQRGGWTDFRMLNYYTKFLGLDGHIKKEEIIIEEDKTALEKRVGLLENVFRELIKQSIKEAPKRKGNIITFTDRKGKPLTPEIIVKRMLK